MDLVIATCKELGITVVAYSYAPLSLSPDIASSDSPNSPLGRGLLTGQIKSRLDFEEGDFRRGFGRFQDVVSFLFLRAPGHSLTLTHHERRISIITSSSWKP